MASTTNIAADYGFGARAPWAAARASEHNMKERARLSGLFPQVNNEPLSNTLTSLVETFKKNAALGAILERRRALEGRAQYVLQGGFGRPPPGGGNPPGAPPPRPPRPRGARNAPPSPGDPMDESSTTEDMDESSTTAYMDESSTTEDMDESSTTEDGGNPPRPDEGKRDRKRGGRNRARPTVQRASRSQGRGAREYAG